MFLRALILALVVLVPGGVEAIASKRGERVIFLVECKCIDRKAFTLFLVFILCPMAFKTEIVLFLLIWFCQVVPINITSAFD